MDWLHPSTLTSRLQLEGNSSDMVNQSTFNLVVANVICVVMFFLFFFFVFRYSDLMVHRLLAVAIGADASYPDLLDKKKTQVCTSEIVH